MSVGAWWRGLKDTRSPGASPEELVNDALQLELLAQLREAQERLDERERDASSQKRKVDYSWLVTTPPPGNVYEIPELERLQLEALFSRVQPEECGAVIGAFRQAMLRKPEPQDVGTILRAVIIQAMERRPKEETMTEWMRKGVVKMRPHPRVVPLGNDEGDTAMYSSTRYSSFSTQSSSSGHRTIDDLPV